MSYSIDFVKRFKKQFKKLTKTKQEKVYNIIERLANGEILEKKYNDHKLQGEYSGCRECHVSPDLLLVYQKRDDVLVLLCVAVGSHSDLF